MPAITAKDTNTPPIDDVAGVMGRTAPTNGAHTDKITGLKMKGCGREDCCQLQGSKNGRTLPQTPSFPRFEFKSYQPGSELIFPPKLLTHRLQPLRFGSELRQWFRPTTLEQLLALKKANPDAKLVGGSSEVGIEVGILGRKYPACIYVADIPELYTVQAPTIADARPTFSFGGNYPLSELEALCKSIVQELPATLSGPFKAMRDQLRYFAGRQIRNTASVGGNIATASPISDLNPVWVALNATVIAASADRGEFELPLASFFTGYRKTTLPPDAVIVRVQVPISAPNSSEREFVKAFKQAKRRDDDISIVCACMVVRIDTENVITYARLAYGGMAAWTVQAPKTQGYLVGKPLNAATIEGALDVLGAEFDLPYDVPGGKDFEPFSMLFLPDLPSQRQVCHRTAKLWPCRSCSSSWSRLASVSASALIPAMTGTPKLPMRFTGSRARALATTRISTHSKR